MRLLIPLPNIYQYRPQINRVRQELTEMGSMGNDNEISNRFSCPNILV